MLAQNSGDLHKARSNHWFFAYLPGSAAVYQNHGGPGPAVSIPNSRLNSAVDTVSSMDRWLPFGFYGAFVAVSVLALYTHIIYAHPAHATWQDVTAEAFGFQHIMAQTEHERLAKKFQLVAQTDVVSGFRARIKAAHEIHDSMVDHANAAALDQLEKEDLKEVQEEKQDALEHADMATAEHAQYLEYLHNATVYDERADRLEAQAHLLANQSVEYHRLARKFYWASQHDTHLEQEYLKNATWERDAAKNITEAEENKEDSMWMCRWNWSRKYVCGALGGVMALGEAESLRQHEADDYQKAVGVERQVLVERTIAMIAYVKAQRAAQEAQLDAFMAEQSHNISMQDQVKAAEEHNLELQNLQKELEDMHLAHDHVKELKYYQGLQVQQDKQAKEKIEDAHGEWDIGTHFLDAGEKAKEKSWAEYDLAAKEHEKQVQLIDQINGLGRQVRLYSSFAAAFALVALACFIMALMTTSAVSLGFYIKQMALAASVTVESHDATWWEGRSIMGDNHNRSYVRQLSCWAHHGLFFTTVAAMQGDQLMTLFAYDSWHMRGEVLLRFAVTAGIFETLLFQAIPHASILPSLTSEYIRNVAIRLISSTMKFAIQMLLLLVLFGENSAWLFDWIHFLSRTSLLWLMILVGSTMAHFWYIEYPYALVSGRRHGSGMSEMTTATYSDITSEDDSLYGGNNMIASRLLDEERGSLGSPMPISPPSPPPRNFETESLLTVSKAEAPGSSSDSQAYSSISLTSTPISHTVVGTEEPAPFPPAAVQRLYEVSIQDEFYGILAHVELVLLIGILLVVCASLPNIAARR